MKGPEIQGGELLDEEKNEDAALASSRFVRSPLYQPPGLAARSDDDALGACFRLKALLASPRRPYFVSAVDVRHARDVQAARRGALHRQGSLKDRIHAYEDKLGPPAAAQLPFHDIAKLGQ